jgi:hypothetical protein
MSLKSFLSASFIILLTGPFVFASDWNCKIAKDIDFINKNNPNIREYRKGTQGPGLQRTTETFTLKNGTSLNFDHNGCKTLADGAEWPEYEVRIQLKESAELPRSPTDTQWFDIVLKVLSDAGLCEISKTTMNLWCSSLKNRGSNSRIGKDDLGLYAWRSSLKKNELGDEETLFFFIVPKDHFLRVGNVVITEGESGD